MVDRHKGGERAILVHIDFPADGMQEDLLEFKELAESAGAEISDIITGSRLAPDSKYFVGSGKAEEIRASVNSHRVELVIFNHPLSPAQERNLEKLFQCRVIDRIGLILDIFAQRARSFEGKLQVELAMLKHLSTRLVRGWTHLERQRGGIGLRGPGETQLETDRRLIRTRIKFITGRLARVQKQREQGRRARKRAEISTVALVGYTNAGKSTLFNRLTGADVYTAHRLFATLDPTLRRIELPEIGPVILADTVGFIRHLPHDLVNAFHATLEEVCEADLLLHVVDAHDENRLSNITEVNSVLESIGAGNVPQILVYNKIDLGKDLSDSDLGPVENTARVRVSALTGQGMEQLAQAVVKSLGKEMVQQTLILPPAKAKLRATLYQLAAVISERIDEEGCHHLLVRLPRKEWDRIANE
ncbi:MAG TPA: ribosome rescue GTPase HflX [Gammaproteobacteria bacterium]|nr:ribosome rescue GTPase HflX [Gammaproteobacteria bacterium]